MSQLKTKLGRYLKIGDFIIIVILIIASFVPLMAFQYQQKISATSQVKTTAIISVDGKEIKQFDLSKSQKKFTYRYTAKDGDYNLIEVNGNQIGITEASCRDQLCVRQGFISKAGQTVVCLPHKLVIEIKNSDGSEEGSLIY